MADERAVPDTTQGDPRHRHMAKLSLKSVAAALERRKSQRLAMRFPIKYRVRGSSRWRAAVCENLSGGGLGLRLPAACPDLATIEVILMPPSVEPMQATCTVRWHTPLPDGKTFAGAAFVALQESPRFMEFLCEHLLEQALEKTA